MFIHVLLGMSGQMHNRGWVGVDVVVGLDDLCDDKSMDKRQVTPRRINYVL